MGQNYFELYEFIHSDTAIKYKINNTASPEILRNLDKLRYFLNNLRHFYGKPIIVTSGYRCPELNAKVGGVPNSAHLYGYAADIVPGGTNNQIVPKNRDMKEFKQIVQDFCKQTTIPFDQCILEKNKTSEWVHISVEPRYRKQIFSLNV